VRINRACYPQDECSSDELDYSTNWVPSIGPKPFREPEPGDAGDSLGAIRDSIGPTRVLDRTKSAIEKELSDISGL
jgi:hypothetical protein